MIIADRYQLIRLAGSGGMGSVFRARDLESDRIVAVKLAQQHLHDPSHARRFVREARALAELDHTHIVHYVDHGVTMTGVPFLVMEWLEGEDLADLLKRETFSEPQTIALGRHICSALAAAHARGIVHRDIKPGNLFLVDSSVDQVKLIDFGVVRRQLAMSMPTKPGTLIGTPGFIAPEQARGEALIDQRADLYSVGAVMFACLTSRAPFEGRQLMAVLAKLLIEPAPHVTELRRDVSVGLDSLIARLLAKHAIDRPSTAEEVIALLDQVATQVGQVGGYRAHSSGPISHREQQVFSVILLGDATHPTNPRARKDLTSLAQTFEANLQQLMDGSMMAVFSTGGEPVEMATRAARCALAFHGRSPGAPVVVATGRGLLEESATVGRVIDDAVSLLFAGDDTYDLDAEGMITLTMPDIVIDEVTAALIDKRFELQKSPTGRGYVLMGEAMSLGGARKLLGKETRCVGRDQELARLEATFQACVLEMQPRVVLITGAAGAGKSRLAHEFVKGLRDSGRQLAIWSAHGETIRQDSPLGMLGELLRQAMKISATATAASQREQIRQCVAERVAPDQVHRVAAFLGEIMGVQFSGNDHVQLREARRDPGMMRDLMQRAWEDWLVAEADGWPVLVVLEDVQWCDRASVRFIDMALRNLDDRSVMVLSMAVPDVHDRIPGLWAGHDVAHIALEPLSQLACMELARQVLPEPIEDRILAHIVDRAGGNPFYLEELLRSMVGQSTDSLPDAIVAMMSARLHTLSPAERRALRAASVFGSDFFIGGVAALLGDDPAEVGALMNHLCDREFVERLGQAGFHDHARYRFHHELLRDTVYASLTDEDRIQAHRGAGEWLEHMGETSATILAEHHWRGKAYTSALPCYQRAAEHALGAEDLDGVIYLTQRAADCGATGQALGSLRALQAEARNWMMEHAQAMTLGLEAMKLLRPGTDLWAGAAHQAVWAASATGDIEQMVAAAKQLMEHMPERPSDEYLAALVQPALHLRAHQCHLETRVVVSVLRAHVRTRKPGPLLAAALAQMNGLLLGSEGKLDLAVTTLRLSVELWTELGSLRHTCLHEGQLGEILCALGQYKEGIDALRNSVTRSRRADFTWVRTAYEGKLAIALARSGALDEAEEILAAQERTRTESDRIHQGMDQLRQVYRAQFELIAGRPERAHEQIAGILDHLEQIYSAHVHLLARTVTARALLALGCADEALGHAQTGMQIIDTVDAFLDNGEANIRLVHAEALHAAGHNGAAREAIIEARRRLLERLEHISNHDMRHSFINRVEENQRTLELASQWADANQSGTT